MSEVEETRVIGVDSDDADDLLGALSSDTAREILAELHEEAATPSEVADRTDTTVQNARYHLENLSEAGLIEVDETRYSPKGREMDVYSPAEPLVMFVGREEDSTTLRDAVRRFLGVIGAIGIAAVFVEYLFRLYAPEPAEEAPRSGGDDMGAFDVEKETTESMQEADAAAEAAPSIAERILDLPPGVVFFLASAAVALVGFGLWYGKRRHNQ
jgi:DNA-binding transcriptional ArsR family regulator